MFDIKAASPAVKEGVFHVISIGNDLIIVTKDADERDAAAERGPDFRAASEGGQLASGIETGFAGGPGHAAQIGGVAVQLPAANSRGPGGERVRVQKMNGAARKNQKLSGSGGNMKKFPGERGVVATNGPGNAAGKKDIRKSSVLPKMVSPTVVIARDEDKVSGVFRRLSNETHV
jgi:hypothetical protein